MYELLAKFLSTPDSLTLSGFLALALKFSALFAACRAVYPKLPAEFSLGRPIQMVNFDLAINTKCYIETKVFEKVIDYLKIHGSGKTGDRILISYQEITGKFEVNKLLASLSEGKNSKAVMLGGDSPDEDPWLSHLAHYRIQLECSRAEDENFKQELSSLFQEKNKIMTLQKSLNDCYNYEAWKDWGCKKISQNSTTIFDDVRLTSVTLCDLLQSQCSSTMEKVEALMRLSTAKKIINILMIKNSTDETISNVKVKILSPGFVVPEVAQAQGYLISSNTRNYSMCEFKAMLPNENHFIIIETGSRRITDSDIMIEQPLSNKFSAKTLRKIMLYSFFLACYVSVFTFLVSSP